MIIIKLRGGLGNQMFQYTFARAQLEAAGGPAQVKLGLDTTWYTEVSRPFVLDAFNILPAKRISNRFAVRISKILNTHLEGFWEDQAYATMIRDILKKEFVLKSPSERLTQRLSTIKPDSIAIHVRRGDFLTVPDKIVITKEYYERAIAHIVKQRDLTNPSITVFSDDIDWCKENMSTIDSYKTTVLDDTFANDAEVMMFMSAHQHLVIADSTFSWWAAFLHVGASSTAQSIVIAPAQWYNDPSRNEATKKALILPSWTMLE